MTTRILTLVLGLACGVGVAACGAICGRTAALDAGTYRYANAPTSDFVPDTYSLELDAAKSRVVERFSLRGRLYVLTYDAVEQ